VLSLHEHNEQLQVERYWHGCAAAAIWP